ncbi:MAG TPA: CvpA family protein [Thermoguttaceae bacterium]|nr:CvpA family protein [Thermoguttaceae bacterium]
MSYVLPVAQLAILFACIACLYTEGLWGNAIRLINVVTSALLATSLWEPVAGWAEGQAGSYTYLIDFVVLWGLFVFFMVMFRLATDFLSKVKMRFPSIADTVGGLLLSVWTGWVMVCFLMMTLHTAPLARNPMDGAFQPEKEAMFLGMAGPDRQWLGFTQRMSLGAFCRSGTEAGVNEKTVFDPDAQFLPKYATRRAALESQMRTQGTLRKNAN